MSPSTSMPGTAIAAAVLAGVGVLPLAIVAFLVVALGGLQADAGRDWSLAAVLVLPPLLQVFALVWFLLGRGRVPLVLAALLAIAVAVLVVVVSSSAGEAVGAGPFVLVICPVLAAALALSPAVGRWLAQARAERRRPAT
jgi:peptidoglycan/LPS O-acetylase OafA/YrhL